MNGFPNNLIAYTKSAAQGARQIRTISLSALRKVFSLMGKTEKIVLGLLLIIALGSFILSLKNIYYQKTTAAAAFGGQFSEGVLGQPAYINPLLAKSEPDVTLTKLVFDALYKYDANGDLSPALAEGLPQISEDQKQYIVTLRKDAKWHNGRSITADDVIYTLQLLKDPSYKSPARAMWQTTTVEKLSDSSVKFSTKDVSGPFANNLTLPILPKNLWQTVDSQNFLLSKYNLEAIGSGPYSIKEIKKLPSGKVQSISLQSFPDYYLGRPKISDLDFLFYDTEEDLLNAFHSREIKAFGFTPLGSNLYVDEDQTEINVLRLPLPQYQVVFFNLNNRTLSDQNIRTALSLATNRQQIIDEVFKGNALLPISPLLFNDGLGKPLEGQSYLEQAKTLLDQNGWPVNQQTGIRTSQKGTPLEITISTNDSLVNSKAAEILANQWRQLEIKVNLAILPAKDLTDSLIKPRDFDVLLFPQKFGADPDPFLFWHSSQVRDPGFNLTGFSDPIADKLITEARTTTNRAEREEKYKQFNDLVTQKAVVLYLDQTEFVYAIDNGIKNINLQSLYDPSQRFSEIGNWYINEKRVFK